MLRKEYTTPQKVSYTVWYSNIYLLHHTGLTVETTTPIYLYLNLVTAEITTVEYCT